MPAITHVLIRNHYFPFKIKEILVLVLILFFLVILKLFLKSNLVTVKEHTSMVYKVLYFLSYRISYSYVLNEIITAPIFKFSHSIFEQFLYGIKAPFFSYAVPDGNLLGRYYNLLNTYDFNTGIATSQIGDSYMNFGGAVTLLYMSFLGFLLKCFYGLKYTIGPLAVYVYTFIWPRFLHGFESPISVYFSMLIYYSGFIIITYYVSKIMFGSLLSSKRLAASSLRK